MQEDRLPRLPTVEISRRPSARWPIRIESGAQGDLERSREFACVLQPPRPLLFLLTIALTWAALPASADLRSVPMRCFYRFVVAGGGVLGGTEFTGNWADSVNERTAVGSGTETESQGWDFDESTQEQMVCSFVVPPDYSFSSETEPSVYLIGWPIEADICALDPFTRTVDFGVSSRAYVNGDLANEAWSSEDTMTLSYPCEDLACSGGIDCNEPFRVKAGVADATNDAGNWSTGDLVFVRIRRMVATDDFNGDFHVAQVLLRYDAGY